jgi:hypothetical protein
MIKDEVDHFEEKYAKNCIEFLVKKVRSGSKIRIRYNYLWSGSDPTQKLLRIRPDVQHCLKSILKASVITSDGLYPASSALYTHKISLFKLLEPVLWIHKYFFRIRNRRSVTLPYGSGSRRLFNYGSMLNPDPIWTFLWPLKKIYVVKYVITR